MPKPTPPESYETQGDGYTQALDRNALIAQISREIPRQKPTMAINLSFQGPQAIVRFHCIEMYLDDRVRVDSLTKEAEKLVKDFVKELKSLYRQRSGSALKMSEDKERRGYSIQKINLNGRFDYCYQTVYDLG